MIAEALKRVQTEGGKGNAVIFIADEQKNYYIQFAAANGQTELYAEASDNKYLSSRYALSDEQIAKLEGLGWTRKNEGNHYRNWSANTDEERLAIGEEVMRTFIEVYGISPNGSIEIELILE
jgi:hypothetical protein